MMKIRLIALVAALMVASCGVKRFDNEARLFVSTMDLDRKISQMIISAVPGTSMNKKAEDLIRQHRPGGIILFGYNLADQEASKLYIRQLQELSLQGDGLPMFISVDQEGGRVVRIKDGVTDFPGAMAAGIADDEKLTRDSAAILGLQLRDFGVNMNFAPVLDVNNNPGNPVINTRSAGSDPLVAARYGTAYIRGLQAAGCAAVGKHFPGHGDTDRDSHLTLPVISHGIDRLRQVELVPFDRAVRSGLECVMSAHIAYPGILGSNLPATHSSYFMKELLRDELKFKGLAVTDCLEMSGVASATDIGESAVRSIEAGIDLILFTSYEKSVPAVLKAVRKAVDSGRISQERITLSVEKIIELKLRYGIMSLENGLVAQGVNPSKLDRKILDRAHEVNNEISRKALYLENGSPEFFKGFTKTIIISSDKAFRTGASLIPGTESFSDVDSAFRRAAGASAGEKVIVVYQSAIPEPGLYDKLSKRATADGTAFALLYSGNPYLLSGRTGVPVLYTFSTTGASLLQGARCAAGEFIPQVKINCALR